MKLVAGTACHYVAGNKARCFFQQISPLSCSVSSCSRTTGDPSPATITKKVPSPSKDIPGKKLSHSSWLHTSSETCHNTNHKSNKLETESPLPLQKSPIEAPHPASNSSPWLSRLQKKEHPNMTRASAMGKFNMHSFNGLGQDLRRFLEEVGTDAKEARYWLRHFQRAAEPQRPFAVIEIDFDILEDDDMLERLCSCVAFLQRHDMKCVLVHGHQLPPNTSVHPNAFQDVLRGLSEHSMKLVSFLEHHGAPARPLFAGTNVLLAKDALSESELTGSTLDVVNINPILWAMESRHIPIVQALGQSTTGQLVAIDITKATAALARQMCPLKVLFVNTEGGINNEMGEVIPNVNLPFDLDTMTNKQWCTSEVKSKVEFISALLKDLPNQSSVVMTSASSLLTELFTHHGSGTFFKIMEPVKKYSSLDGIDRGRLTTLIEQTFKRKLSEDYFESIQPYLEAIYLIEGYQGAAIILKKDGLSIPYLDKFVVSSAKQPVKVYGGCQVACPCEGDGGDNAGQMLWDSMKNDLPQLFWRSRNANFINPWYFTRSEGSWTDGKWTVFWYGEVSHQESSDLIKDALATPISFKTMNPPLQL